jgi:hypothetical protein
MVTYPVCTLHSENFDLQLGEAKFSNYQIFESLNPNYYYLCRAILLAQLFWRNKVAAKFMCLNEKETL